MLRESIISPSGKIVVRDKVQVSIDRLKAFEPSDGYYLAFSGGKDSIVIKRLADMAEVKYDAHYNVTTVDPPELVYFIREHHPDVIFDYPERTMWQLIVDKGIPPSRVQRYCCQELKEGGGKGRVTVTGVRWAESARRKRDRNLVDIGSSKKNSQRFVEDNDEARRMVEQCYRDRKTTVNPIIDWADDEVWEFIHEEKLPYCSLYDEGFTRLGCILCPLQQDRDMERDAERWPKYAATYERAFQRMIDKREASGKTNHRKYYTTGRECFDRWLKRNGADSGDKPLDGQIDLMEDDL